MPLTANQYDALVSFTYNVGASALERSTLLKRVNAGDHKGAADEFLKWNKANGKVLAGLTRRRASESLLYQGIPDLNYDGKADPSRRKNRCRIRVVADLVGLILRIARRFSHRLVIRSPNRGEASSRSTNLS